MKRRVILTIRLVPEASELPASEIKYDIEKESADVVRGIPWAAEIEEIEVVDQSDAQGDSC